jgi:4-hydroxy-tetrahydrodipicolinate synthase
MDKVRKGMTGISGVPVTPYAGDGSVDTTKLTTLIKGLAAAAFIT